MRGLRAAAVLAVLALTGAPARAEDPGVMLLPSPGAAPVLAPEATSDGVSRLVPMTGKAPAPLIPADTMEEEAKVLPVTETVPPAAPAANPFEPRIAAFVAAGDLDGALLVARQAVHDAPRDGAAGPTVVLARLLLRAGRPADAARVLAALPADASADVVTTRARAAIALGRAADALPALAALWQAQRTADQGAPIAIPLLVARAERASGQLAAAQALLDGLTPASADVAAVFYARALAAGSAAAAQAALAQAIQHDPDMNALPDYFVAEAATAPAADALAQTLAGRAQAPDAHVAVLRTQAALARARGRTAEAEDAFAAAERRFPDGAPYAAHAALLADEGKLGAAGTVLDAGLRRAPRDPALLRAASELAGRRHDYAQAITLAQRLLAVDPAPASRGTPARFLIGRLFTAGGDDAGAVKIYRQLLKDWPDDAGAMADLAAALVRAGEPAAALPFARHAREVFPDSAGPAATLGWALLLAGHTDEAVAPLAEAARLAPDDAQLRYRLARAQTAFGARTDARSNVVAALQLNPDFPEAPAARALLMELTQ